jgi:hypothetical protein
MPKWKQWNISPRPRKKPPKKETKTHMTVGMIGVLVKGRPGAGGNPGPRALPGN